MEERYLAALDLGSSKVALMIAKVEGSDVQVIYYGKRPSEGIRCGGVFNALRARGPVLALIQEAEESLGIKITQVLVGTPGYPVLERVGEAVINKSDEEGCVTREEIDALKNIALDDYQIDNPGKEAIYGCVPQSFSTDDQIQMTDEDEIVGMMSSVVAGHYKMFIGRKKLLDNIDQIFNALQLANHKVFTPVAVGDVILSSDEKDSGVALVDMGAGVTSVSVYMGGILRHYASIPFGGATVTSDIRLESGFSERLSENLKLAYGACIPEKLVTLSDKIIRVNYPENGNFRDIKVQYLSRIIAEREKEIIQAVLWEIQQSGYADELRSGVVLTGGAAEMTNLSSLMSSISGYNVRIGYPRKYFNCTGFPEAREASAEVILGLIMAGKTQEMLNCVGRIDRPAVEPDTHDEEEAAEEPQAGGDKLFSDEEMDKMVEKPEKKKKPEKVKKNRPRPVWITKISDFVENASELFDGAD